ncbi:MAG: tRNA (adenosine(37)-N6)-dimethylallyltransferase MiaA [Pseudomonadota bacterium]|nr:tRNA (adenosine(37)-N6)-dimethylallyltransferase MiaA [Pseudomonadota bacterium]MDP1903024.1 tRNA (adenosine(37)-N6)-dimethylallyltransferase MiaA [Pseudomonadota bacterium]MDP2352204.1 tRNA (adenosine(37)-N6)-dimethylallyltransferase MiaA [Pseudomonadota bacterium]
MGPTASGKTDLAVALAERFPVEIISVDSALVYRGMDIGTAKPDAATLARAPHHLIDILSPTESYSAARFRADALRLMHDIVARGRIPLLVGGTMLYFKALKEGLAELPVAAPALRAELEARAKEEGWPALHAELARLDPETAARLAPNDSQRIQRALEVCISGGEPLSALLARQEQSTDLPCCLLEIALMHDDRAWLHERINMRFKTMLDAGLVEELRALRERWPLKPELPSMRCVGYRQSWRYLEGEISGAELFASGAAATRQLAKRQITWLRGWEGATVVDCRAPDLLERVSQLIEL